MFGATWYYPWYISLATSRTSSLVEPIRLLTNRWTRAVSSAMVLWWGCLYMSLCSSLVLMAEVLWKICSSRNNPHSCWLAKLQSGWSFQELILGTAATLGCILPPVLNHLVLWVSIFAHSLEVAKLLYCKVTVSSKAAIIHDKLIQSLKFKTVSVA